MTIAREEIFGPVLAILTYRSEPEAISIANGTSYGLAAVVWSGDPARVMRVARQLKAGHVSLNGARLNVRAPFGGYKRFGLGRELGAFGPAEYFHVKSVQR